MKIKVLIAWVSLLFTAMPSLAQLKVSVNLPLTGDLKTYGAAVQEGVLMALDELNKQGEVPLQFTWEDNQSSSKEAAVIASRNLRKGVDVYVSGLKPQFMAIHDQVRDAGIPHFVWVFDMHLRKGGENNFRTYVNFKVEPPLFLNYAAQKNIKRAAIIYVQLPHTDEEYNTAIIPGLKAHGVKELLVEPYDMNKMDFRDIAVRFAKFKPELMILSGFQANFIGIIRAFRQLGLMQEGNTIATYDLIDAIPLLGSNELEGIRVAAPEFLLEPYDAKFREWRGRFIERYHKDPIYTHAYGYDMAWILAGAARSLENLHERSALIAAIQNFRGEGITGPLAFDEEGDLKINVALGIIRDGKLKRETSR